MFKRLFILMSASVLLCILVSGFTLLLFFFRMWKSDRLTHLSGDALSLSQGVASLYNQQKGGPGALENALAAAAEPSITMARNLDAEIFFVSPDGAVLLCSDPPPTAHLPAPCERHKGLVFESALLERVRQAADGVYEYEGAVGLRQFGGEETSAPYLLAAAPVFSGETILCSVIVLQPVQSAYVPYTTQFIRMLLITALLAVFVSFIFSLIVSLRVVKPLKTITAATKKYAGGDFSAQIPVSDSYQELSDLIASFNSMAESLAATEASRSSFIANISHELKTPMTIISGFIDGVLDHTIPEEDVTKYLHIVSDETHRLSRLVIAMLNMSKIEAGKLGLTLSDVRLRDLIYQTMIGFEPIISQKQIEIAGLDTLGDITVKADETLFQQIIYNLIDNAVKFTPERGEIRLTLTAEKRNAFLSIRNTGRGIPQDELPLIFDRFYKVDKSRGLDTKSFGMGLSIVKSIVELHQGSITVNSEPDAFTEFQIRLPMDLKLN